MKKLILSQLQMQKLHQKSLSKTLLTLGFLFSVPVLPISAYYALGNPTGYVNDFAEVISDEQEVVLEAKLDSFEQTSTNEISVVTISTLDGDTVENFAEKLFQEWGIGKEDNDNGVLMLVAVNDRKMRIEVGYGLEGALTDAQSSWIIRETLTPAFREERYADGIDTAIDQIIAATQGEYIPENDEDLKPNFGVFVWIGFFVFQFLMAIFGSTKSWWLGGLVGGIAGVLIGLNYGFVYLGIGALALLVPLGLLLDYLVSKHAGKSGRGTGGFWRGGSSGGGSSGGGFGGFSGGSSGGGGSSGSW